MDCSWKCPWAGTVCGGPVMQSCPVHRTSYHEFPNQVPDIPILCIANSQILYQLHYLSPDVANTSLVLASQQLAKMSEDKIKLGTRSTMMYYDGTVACFIAQLVLWIRRGSKVQNTRSLQYKGSGDVQNLLWESQMMGSSLDWVSIHSVSTVPVPFSISLVSVLQAVEFAINQIHSY